MKRQLEGLRTFARSRPGVYPAVLLAGLVLLLGTVAGCGGDSASAGGSNTISLVAYSTPREAYEEIIPAFQDTPAGEGVDFEQSYAASGEQSRAVESGLAADVVAFSLEPDITRLIDADMVATDWSKGQHKGMVTDSVVVFAVRPGNPENIQTWDDLLREGIEVITPNPFTSGGAQWNIMAAYGAQLELGKSEDEAVEYLKRPLRQPRARPGQERARGAADLRRGQGRRHARRTRTRRSSPSRPGSRSSTSCPTRRS